MSIVIHRANAATTEILPVCAMPAMALMTAVVTDIAIAINNGYNIGKYHGNHH
jgi:hypothetical protein